MLFLCYSIPDTNEEFIWRHIKTNIECNGRCTSHLGQPFGAIRLGVKWLISMDHWVCIHSDLSMGRFKIEHTVHTGQPIEIDSNLDLQKEQHVWGTLSHYLESSCAICLESWLLLSRDYSHWLWSWLWSGYLKDYLKTWFHGLTFSSANGRSPLKSLAAFLHNTERKCLNWNYWVDWWNFHWKKICLMHWNSELLCFPFSQFMKSLKQLPWSTQTPPHYIG